MLTEKELTPATMSQDERMIAMAIRIGKYEAMLKWMADEGRLKNIERDMLKEELSKNLFQSDEKHFNQIR